MCDENVERSDHTLVHIALYLGATDPTAPIAAARHGLGPELMAAYKAMVRANAKREAARRGAEFVDILGGDVNDFSESELRSIYMSSLGAAAHASVEVAAQALGVSTSDYFLAGGSVGVHGLNARQIQAKAREMRRR